MVLRLTFALVCVLLFAIWLGWALRSSAEESVCRQFGGRIDPDLHGICVLNGPSR
jgi:hypothetical protein